MLACQSSAAGLPGAPTIMESSSPKAERTHTQQCSPMEVQCRHTQASAFKQWPSKRTSGGQAGHRRVGSLGVAQEVSHGLGQEIIQNNV